MRLFPFSKRMVFRDKIKQIGSFFLHSRVHVEAVEGLINCPDARLKGIVFFAAEKITFRTEPHLFNQGMAFLVIEHIG